MKIKTLLSVTFCLVFNFTFSQNKNYEKGYYINDKNNKVECLIKNEDWDYNPTEFKYKTDENANPNVMSVKDIQEFEVGGEYKFKKAKVKIDKSSDIYQNASGSKTLNLEDDVLLLRVRVEGKGILYSYHNENYTRFFYSLDQGPIEQLSYKLYYDAQEQSYRKNEIYKQEILNNLKCDKITLKDIENLSYTSASLTDIFTNYNICNGSNNNQIEEKKNIKTLEIHMKAGIIVSRLKFDDGEDEVLDFGSKAELRPAVEAEVNLSNKRKNFSILFEGAYEYYKSSAKNGTTVNYKAIDFSIGIRKYMYLNPSSMVFINGYVTYAIAVDSNINTYQELTKSFSTSLGVGYLYNKKYTLDLRYDFNRNLLSNYLFQSAKYSSIGLNFGYKFL